MFDTREQLVVLHSMTLFHQDRPEILSELSCMAYVKLKAIQRTNCV